MQMVHRISFDANEDIHQRFKAAGIDITLGSNLLQAKESDAGWPLYAQIIKELGAFDFVTTTYTATEIKNSSLLTLNSKSHKGYPQPENDFEYKKITFDTSDYCKKCGGGLLDQIAPFHLKGEPK